MVLQRSFLRIYKTSLLETFGSLKIRKVGCLQLLRKPMSNFSLFFLYSSFSYFRKSFTVTLPYFSAISLQIFIIFLDSSSMYKWGFRPTNFSPFFNFLIYLFFLIKLRTRIFLHYLYHSFIVFIIITLIF